MNRALFSLAIVAGVVADYTPAADQLDFRLQVAPAVVYKVDDPGNTGTSSFVFDVAAICTSDCTLSPISASVELSRRDTIVSRQEWTTEQLQQIKGTRYRVSPSTPRASPTLLLTLPEAFDLHFYFRQAQALAIDSVRVRVVVANAEGRRAEQRLKIPVRYYQQKTVLNIPFSGRGVAGQDWITNGGHGGGIGTDFAVDLRGLDGNGADQLNDANENASAAGWGREIRAPAAGTVRYARNDVPDNPRRGEFNIKSLAALHDPIMAFMGNCVIIDHGNSEYSVLAHMQHGSVVVKEGAKVVAGQAIGRLGNSGSSFGPHLHYQLQSASQLFRGQSLPFRFQGIEGPQLSRGGYVGER